MINLILVSAMSVLRVINFSRVNGMELHLARDHPFFVDEACDVSDEKCQRNVANYL
jgi:hypothetical protein